MPLTVERLRKVISYNPDTGHLTWNEKPPNRPIKIGDRAGYVHWKGYRRITIDNREYAEHRIVWLLNYGEWPALAVDHINGVKDDNRIVNLRQATNGQNRANSGPNKNRAMPKGVTKKKYGYVAQITTNNKRVCLGFFKTPDEAAAKYREAAKIAHGEFFRDG